MKVLILYRPSSEHSRLVEGFVRDFKIRYPDREIELMDSDSRDGSATASLYDVLQFPAVMVIQNDGAVQKIWLGEVLPLIDEVVSYVRL